MLFSKLSVLLCGVLGTVQADRVHDAAHVSRRAITPNPPEGHWIDAWASMPQLTEPANLPPAPFNTTGAVFVNSTIRQTLYMTVTASQIRLKISNAFGTTPLPITAVTVALPANNTAGIHHIQPSTLQKATFSGKDSISIPNGALAVSDPLDFPIKSQTILTVTIYLATGQLSNSITSHPGSRTTSFWQFGDATLSPSLAITSPSTQSAAHWYFLSSIEAWVPPQHASFLVVGDSITDGRGSTTDANNRWPDQLLARLQASPATSHIGIGNLAAGGNRVLRDGLGPNAWARVERDVLAHPGVKWVLVFEGVNDIGTAAPEEAEQEALYEGLTQAYGQIAGLVRAHGIPVFGGTITPFSAPANSTVQPYSHPVRERTRVRVNEFIRESGVFDAVVDFDAAVRDPSAPERLSPEYDVGDYLHLNPRGYGRMAEVFPLGLFAEFEGGIGGFY